MSDILSERIKFCAKNDKAKDSPEKMFLYLSEEVGEVAEALSVKNWIEKQRIKRIIRVGTMRRLIATLGNLFALGVDEHYISETISKKVERWEARVKNNV